MKAKTKRKPISLLNANENVLSNQEENEKNQALNSQPITGSQTHSALESRENEFANKSQEKKVKLQRERKTLKP